MKNYLDKHNFFLYFLSSVNLLVIMKQSNNYVHPAAVLIGDVHLGDNSSIWPGTVIRADMNKIVVGDSVNIQDNCTLHSDSNQGIEIGDYTLVGHNVMLHGCTIGKACLIGIGSVILDGAVIGNGAMVMAGCTVRGGKVIPPMSMVLPDTKKGGGAIKILPNKAKPKQTLLGTMEYIALAKRIQKNIFGPFSESEVEEFVKQADVVYSKLFPSI